MDKTYHADDIQSLSIGEAIRIRPHLYFDKCFREKTLDSLPFEVLCHAFDEYFDGVCKTIEIAIANDSFTVNYDAGISLEQSYNGLSKAEIIMTQIFACRNEKKHLAVGEAFCSLGMATINFAAEQCTLTTVCNGTKGQYSFKNGITVSRVTEPVQGQPNGTKIFIKPDSSILGSLGFTYAGIQERASQIHAQLKDLAIIVHNNIDVA